MTPPETGCEWCGKPFPRTAPHQRHCSTRCRQATHRFGRECIPPARAERPIRIGYGDPPYPGKARRYYKGHRDYAGEVDHRALLEQLQGFDAWALSTSSEALPMVLSLCTAARVEVNVGAWVRGARPGKSVMPRGAWEPVIYRGGRAELLRGEAVDVVACGSKPRTMDPRRVVGAKPAAFCFWLFALLGARPGDHFVDLFPGSGGVTRAWDLWTRRAPTAPPVEEADPMIVRALLAPGPGERATAAEQLELVPPRRPSARARRSAA